MIAYAKVLGLELAPQKMRVNCICPAMVWTELVERDAQMTGADYHEAEKAYPLGAGSVSLKILPALPIICFQMPVYG